MPIHLLKSLTAATFALCLVAGSAAAQGKGHDKNKQGDPAKGDVRHPVVVGSNGEYQRVPPGLAKKGGLPPGLAKKGGLPPGQAKKLYRATDGVVVLRDVFGRHGYTVVRTQPYGNSQYVYYRQGNGLVQRAIILPGAQRLTFQNVPQSLLQEVLARLY